MDCRSWWWTGRPGVLWFMGSQRVGHDWGTDWTESSWALKEEMRKVRRKVSEAYRLRPPCYERERPGEISFLMGPMGGVALCSILQSLQRILQRAICTEKGCFYHGLITHFLERKSWPNYSQKTQGEKMTFLHSKELMLGQNTIENWRIYPTNSDRR